MPLSGSLSPSCWLPVALGLSPSIKQVGDTLEVVNRVSTGVSCPHLRTESNYVRVSPWEDLSRRLFAGVSKLLLGGTTLRKGNHVAGCAIVFQSFCCDFN